MRLGELTDLSNLTEGYDGYYDNDEEYFVYGKKVTKSVYDSYKVQWDSRSAYQQNKRRGTPLKNYNKYEKPTREMDMSLNVCKQVVYDIGKSSKIFLDARNVTQTEKKLNVPTFEVPTNAANLKRLADYWKIGKGLYRKSTKMDIYNFNPYHINEGYVEIWLHWFVEMDRVKIKHRGRIIFRDPNYKPLTESFESLKDFQNSIPKLTELTESNSLNSLNTHRHLL